MHGFVLGTEMPPLKTVHWPEVTLFTVSEAALIQELSWTIRIPDTNTCVVV
jgi:hypothetical protein